MKESFLKLCPKCNSTDVSMDTSNPLQPAVGLPASYVCNDCGYTAYMFPEVDPQDASSIKKKIIKADEDSEKVDANYGRFYVNVVWRFLGPLAIISGLLIAVTDLLNGMVSIIIGTVISYLAFRKKSG